MKRIVFISLLILILLFLVMNNCKTEAFADAKLEEDKIMWENKITLISQVIENLKKNWKECGFDEFTLEPKDFTIINSRKRLIELLPVTKMLPKLDYDKIKCFVSKFDPTNYVVISKTITTVPKVLKPMNIIIVNNILYHSTPYGVLKYRVPALAELNTNSALNASIETGILNDYNNFNTTDYPIYNLDGRILQKIGLKILDLKNNDEYEFTNINNKIELLNKKSIDKIRKDAQEITNSIKQADITNNKIKDDAKDKQNEVAKKIEDDIKKIQQNSQTKVKEQMVDVGGILELNVKDVQQLKTLDPKTFLPIVKVVAAQTTDDAKKAVDTAAKKLEDTTKKADEATKKADEATKKADEATKKAAEAAKKAADDPSNTNATKEAADAAKKAADAKKAAADADAAKKDADAKKAAADADAAKKTVDAAAAKKAADADAKLKAELEAKNKLVIKPEDVELNKILDTLVSVIEYDGIIYMCQPNIIRPLSNWAVKLNSIIKKSKFTLKGVIPHYYFSNNKFNYAIIFIFNDGYCVILNKEDLSEPIQVKNVLGITFDQSIPDKIGCDDLKVILEQMTKANVVTNDKSTSILKRYKCAK